MTRRTIGPVFSNQSFMTGMNWAPGYDISSSYHPATHLLPLRDGRFRSGPTRGSDVHRCVPM